MTKIDKIFFIFVRTIRFILNIPLLIIIYIGNIYANFLLLIDKKNHTSFWQETLQKSIDKFISKKIKISDNPKKFIQFYHPTNISSFRSKTLFTKEPETIEWLNNYGSNKHCLFDIGANLGLYSIFYAKKFNAQVYAFEPSYKNLDLMIRNIKLNSLQNNITVVSNPLTKKYLFSNFYQNNFIAGQAQASFGNKIAELEKTKTKTQVSYRTLGLSIDNMLEQKLLEIPMLIKIDVDGNEVEIIQGCQKLLQVISKGTLLVEIRKETQDTIHDELSKFGFKKIKQVKDNTIWEK